MKVYMIGMFSLPDGTAAAQLIKGMIKIINESGNEAVVIDTVESREVGAIQKERMLIDGAEVIKIVFPYNLNGRLDKKLNYKIIREEIEPGNAIMCYNYEAFIMLRFILDKKAKFKIVPMITEWYQVEKGLSLNLLFQRLDIAMRMKHVAKYSDAMVVCSSLLDNYYKESCPTVIIPTVVDYALPKWQQDSIPLDQQEINFIYAGSLGVKKDDICNVLKIIEKASEGKPYKIRILGVSKEDFVKKYPEEKGISDNPNHIFMGRRPHQECIQLIKSSDYSVLYRESNIVANAGFPTKFGESMACGTPMICTNTSDLADYIEEGKNGFIIDFDVDKAAQEIKKVFSYTREDIDRQKDYTANLKLFDYKKYVEPFKSMIDALH